MMEQLTLAHMPAQLFACTPSRLATFGCPRRYRFTYVDRPSPPRGAPWGHNMLGATAHVALAQWWSLPRPHRTPEHGADLVHDNWQNIGFRDDAQSARACARTAGWVETYLADQPRPAADPIGVERTVAARTERLAVSGRVDRVDERNGELVVVDYKTGRRAPTDEDAGASQALALYALGVCRTLRRECRRVELHHLPTRTVAVFEHSPQTLRRHVDRAEATARDITAADDMLAAGAEPDDVFPPAPSTACAWCDFRRLCPEGRAAAPDLEPWSGLPEDL